MRCSTHTTPSADFCTAVRAPCGSLSPSGYPWDTAQISWGKPHSLPRTPAEFTVQVLDGYGLRDFLPARPTRAASYPVAVRQVAISFHASFRRSSRFRPCASLVLHLHQVAHGTFTPRPLGMPSTQDASRPPTVATASLDHRSARRTLTMQAGTEKRRF